MAAEYRRRKPRPEANFRAQKPAGGKAGGLDFTAGIAVHEEMKR
jgi:hypothetical protein